GSCFPRRLTSWSSTWHRHVGLPSLPALRVCLFPPRRGAAFAQGNLGRLHPRTGRRLLVGPLGAPHLPAPRHQDAGELCSPLFGYRGVSGTPPAPADQKVM